MSNNEKKKSRLNINPYVLIFCVIIIGFIASYLVTPGVFDREVVNGRSIVVPGSFKNINAAPLSIFSIFRAIPKGLIGSSSIIFLVLLVGGAIEVYNRTGAINMGVKTLVQKIGRKNGGLVLFLIMVIFAILGGFLGWIEAAIPFVPIVIPIVLALGYDAMTAAALCILGLMVGFAVGPTNMYTIGIAHQIAQLPMFSGFGLRFAAFVTLVGVSFIYLMVYATRVKRDPSKSLVADIDVSSIKIDYSQDEGKKVTGVQILSLVILAVTFAVVVYGMMKFGWTIDDMSAAFLLSGIVVGIINRIKISEIADAFIVGAKGSIGGAMIVGTARGVQWILEQGGIIDPIINNLSTLLSGLPPIGSAIGVLVVVSILNGLVPSGSGKAVALMPILIPLGEMIGLTRQTTTFAYQFGDGIANMAWFTYGTLLIFLSYAKVPINRWYKFLWPLLVILYALAILFLFIAISIGYGPA